ncbi:MAG: hypothetical protein J6W26_00325 [Bacteroidales bacterium]|nr:hypothetical protein [Bacteroidales bacterium]
MRSSVHFFLFLVMISFSAQAHVVTEENGHYIVEHSWRYKADQCSLSLTIDKDLYDYYQNDREHLVYKYELDENYNPPGYSGFMLSEYDRPLMKAIAGQLEEMASSESEQIELAVSFVQSLPYAYDSVSKGIEEYVRYPVETLVDGCGDCEDKVALLAAILHEMPEDFILLVLPEHLAIGVSCEALKADSYLLFQDKKYYYVETTNPNWKIGQIPEEYHSSDMEVFLLQDVPNLQMRGVRFESEPTSVIEKARCNFTIDLVNLGPGKVTNLQLSLRLISLGRKNRLLAEQRFELDDLMEGASRTENVTFKSYIRENCMLQVEITGNEIPSQYYETLLDYSRTQHF